VPHAPHERPRRDRERMCRTSGVVWFGRGIQGFGSGLLAISENLNPDAVLEGRVGEQSATVVASRGGETLEVACRADGNPSDSITRDAGARSSVSIETS
jgi:hypothetical protein